MKRAIFFLCMASAAWPETPVAATPPTQICTAAAPTTTMPSAPMPSSTTPPPPGPANGWDSSGNGLLMPTSVGGVPTGTYYFRYVKYSVADQQGDLGHADALYGNITFTPTGYNIPTTAMWLDSDSIPLAPQSVPTAITGTYSIAACGFGFIQNPLSKGDVIWGGVSANGVFIGSSTETTGQFNDLFIAAPMIYFSVPSLAVGSKPALIGPPILDTLQGVYSVAYINFPNGFAGDLVTAGFQMAPQGNGNIGPVNIQMYQGNSSTPLDLSESISYHLSAGCEVIAFPDDGYVIAGQKYFYITPDGSFVFGGGPDSFDFFVGVQTQGLQTSSTEIPGFSAGYFSGLFFQGGIDEIMTPGANLVGSLQTYYGSFEPVTDVILDHQRIVAPLGSPLQGPLNPAPAPNPLQSTNCVLSLSVLSCPYQVFSYTYADPYSLGFGNTAFGPNVVSNYGYTDSATGRQYILGANGASRLGFGTYPNLGISIALKAPAFTLPSTPTPYIHPDGVVNSATYSPFTAGISSYELITIFAANLGSASQVYFNGNPVVVTSPLPGQFSVVVPPLTPLDSAEVQVAIADSSGTTMYTSPVWAYVNNTTIGVSTLSTDGLGAVQATLQVAPASGNAQVSPSNPAPAQSTVLIEAVGLGMPSGSSTSASPPLTVTVGGTQASYGAIQTPADDSGMFTIPVTLPKGVSGVVPLVIASADSTAAQTTIAISPPPPPATTTSTTTTVTTTTSPSSTTPPSTTSTTTTSTTTP
jgi:hypothetical protein